MVVVKETGSKVHGRYILGTSYRLPLRFELGLSSGGGDQGQGPNCGRAVCEETAEGFRRRNCDKLPALGAQSMVVRQQSLVGRRVRLVSFVFQFSTAPGFSQSVFRFGEG